MQNHNVLSFKMKKERVMGIEPTCQVKIEEVVLRQVSCLKGTG